MGDAWKDAFSTVCSGDIASQRDAFLKRFTLQFSKQELEAKEVVKLGYAAADMFIEKSKSGNGKSLQYAGVEFGDVYTEFCGENMTFVQRKKTFAPFDLDNNGLIDLAEFLLYFYRDKIVAAYKDRHGVSEVDNEAEALMKEMNETAMYIDPKLDSAVLGLANLAASYEASVEAAKKEAQEGGGVKKVQLGGNLKKLETKYEEDKKGFISEDAIAKKKGQVAKKAEAIVGEMKAILDKEDEDARGPQKK
uniref:EF-hand domain-containing protein n=1 Tax=Lotharella globosa TaxID=91324 RepID=A0A7S3Z9W5_9EUKA|mmetsp:Transcript_11050/g.12643  ORF Transcript_11050/g.12643 Transcript_11050/m.12643 type:complete len:249 (-) Transcript_11050:234-980(-)|eukprot:CAMPEP_0184031194 /NCGR_PEP_ID=MMETSP0955-20130417/2038_1 /TAXON_ID=627963 /ORGANISM="Aplanochytrium sp, Strain PBS07" /LENGTH=248 /DNA_ID=CAMNT_0026316869 /DNA_START=288 /DNA_END=1034 /DNA_ORIENTATION=-